VSTATSRTFIGEQTLLSDSKGQLNGCLSNRCTSTIAASTAGGYLVMTATDVTKIIEGPDNPRWLSKLRCFVLKNCTINNTSEFSNIAQPTGTAPLVSPTAATTPASALAAHGSD